MLEENLAFAESGDIAVSFSSGMAAVSGVLGILTGAGSENPCAQDPLWMHLLAPDELVSPPQDQYEVYRLHRYQ